MVITDLEGSSPSEWNRDEAEIETFVLGHNENKSGRADLFCPHLLCHFFVDSHS